MVLKHGAISQKVIVVAAVATALTACSSGPKAASKDFYSDIGNGQTDQAMKLIDTAGIPPAAQLVDVNSKIRAAMEATHQQAEAHGGLDQVKILSLKQIDADHAKVSAEMVFHDGTVQQSTDTWIKRNGKWLMAVTQN